MLAYCHEKNRDVLRGCVRQMSEFGSWFGDSSLVIRYSIHALSNVSRVVGVSWGRKRRRRRRQLLLGHRHQPLLHGLARAAHLARRGRSVWQILRRVGGRSRCTRRAPVRIGRAHAPRGRSVRTTPLRQPRICRPPHTRPRERAFFLSQQTLYWPPESLCPLGPAQHISRWGQLCFFDCP